MADYVERARLGLNCSEETSSMLFVRILQQWPDGVRNAEQIVDEVQPGPGRIFLGLEWRNALVTVPERVAKAAIDRLIETEVKLPTICKFQETARRYGRGSRRPIFRSRRYQMPRSFREMVRELANRFKGRDQ